MNAITGRFQPKLRLLIGRIYFVPPGLLEAQGAYRTLLALLGFTALSKANTAIDHHSCCARMARICMTQRGFLKDLLGYSMFGLV
jgi:hypothetical protein